MDLCSYGDESDTRSHSSHHSSGNKRPRSPGNTGEQPSGDSVEVAQQQLLEMLELVVSQQPTGDLEAALSLGGAGSDAAMQQMQQMVDQCTRQVQQAKVTVDTQKAMIYQLLQQQMMNGGMGGMP